jgi:hypothetical protein
VVATDIPSLRDEADLVSIAQTAEEFVSAAHQALTEDTSKLTAMRQERASRNTWRDRVERISALIERVRIEKERPL